MITYSIMNDTVLSVNNKQIDFRHNINKVININGLLIIHVFDSIVKGATDMSKQPLNSVFALDQNGNMLWNIKDIIPRDEVYTGINKDNNGDLVVYTFMGIAELL